MKQLLHLVRHVAPAVALSLAAAALHAAPSACTGTLSCFIGADTGSPSPSNDPAKNPRPNADQAHGAFIKKLLPGSVKTESLESETPESPGAPGAFFPFPSALGLTGLSQTVGAPGGAPASVKNTPSDPGTGEYFGRFNVTPNGSQWWETSYDFTLGFGPPISAFGFYATDIADFDGRLNLILGLEGGGTVTLSDVIPTSGTITGNGAVMFFGFVDTQRRFTSVEFDIVQTATNAIDFDALGFDDLTTGALAPPNGVPEPATLALTGAALLSLAALRRRRAR